MADVAPAMSAAFDVPSASTRTHCQMYVTPLRPSMSTMSDSEAISVCPSRAVPEMEGLPVAASFDAVTSMVMVYAEALSTVPSLTLKVKLV